MKYEHYEHYVRYFRKHPEKIDTVIILNKILTLLGYIMYPLIILHRLIYDRKKALRFILIPGIAFLTVSIFRKIVNRKRPYEHPEVNTLTKRDKKGESFPSRHVFSYILISILLMAIFPIPGIIMLITGLLLAVIRVILGVHYPSDVIAGAILGIISGLLTI